MKLTEINNIILGNTVLPLSSKFKELPDYTDEIKKSLKLFEGLYNKQHFQSTKSHTEFYEANPMLDAAMTDTYGKEVQVFKKEWFYSILCETYIPHVPSELTSILVLTRRECESPNQMVAALDKSKMRKYLSQRYHNNVKIIKEIIDSLWGYEVNLVTDVRPMVTNSEVVEIYISNINSILLCDISIRDILTDSSDIESLKYTSEKGIVLGDSDIPLRTLIQSFGIVKNDLDLRKVFLTK